MIAGTAWMDRAVCASIGGNRWDAFGHDRQRQVCSGCPVRAECLRWSLTVEQGAIVHRRDVPRHPLISGLDAGQRRELFRKIARS